MRFSGPWLTLSGPATRGCCSPRLMRRRRASCCPASGTYGWGAPGHAVDVSAGNSPRARASPRRSTPTSATWWAERRSVFLGGVDGPDHALIELNTARHHDFGRVHMFSADAPAAGRLVHEGDSASAVFRKRRSACSRRADRAGRVRDRRSRLRRSIFRWSTADGAIRPRRAAASSITWDSASTTSTLQFARMRNDGVKVTTRAFATRPMAASASHSSKARTRSRSS